MLTNETKQVLCSLVYRSSDPAKENAIRNLNEAGVLGDGDFDIAALSPETIAFVVRTFDGERGRVIKQSNMLAGRARAAERRLLTQKKETGSALLGLMTSVRNNLDWLCLILKSGDDLYMHGLLPRHTNQNEGTEK